MKFFSKYVLLTVMAIILPFTLLGNDYVVEDQPIVIEKAITLENCGILKQKDSGYLYLQVTNDFVAQLLPLIQCEGRIVPTRYYTSKRGVGAHISVMYGNERIEKEIWNVAELGHSFPFVVKELRSVKVSRHGKMKKVWLLAVEAPTLEKLREQYGLPSKIPSKIKGHDFHITIGYQLPSPVTVPHEEIEFFISIEDDLDEESFNEAA